MAGLDQIVENKERFLTHNPVVSGFLFGTATFLGVYGGTELAEQLFQAYDLGWSVNSQHILDYFAGAAVGFNSYLKRTQLKTIESTGLNFKKLKKKLQLKKHEKGEEKTIEKAWFGSSAGTALTIIADVARKDFPKIETYTNGLLDQPQQIMLLSAQAIAAAMLTTYIFRTAAPYIKKDTARAAFTKLEVDLYELLNLDHLSEKKLESYVKRGGFSDLTLKYAQKKSKQGDYSEAFRRVLDGFEQQRSDILKQKNKALKHHTLRESLYRIAKDINNKPDDFAAYFNLSMVLGMLDENEDMCWMMDKFKNIINNDSDPMLRLNGNLGYAVLLKKTKQDDKFNDLMKEIIKKYEQSISPIGTSQTYRIEEDDFSSQTFAIRKSMEKSLLVKDAKYNDLLRKDFESMKNQEIAQSMMRDDWKIVDTSQIISMDRDYFAVSFFKRGKSFRSMMQENYDQALMKEMVDFLNVIQSSAQAGKISSSDLLKDEFVKKLSKQQEKELENIILKVKDNIPLFFEGFEKFHSTYDIDAHGDNWVIGSKKVKIDNQYRKPSIVLYDNSKLTLQGIPYQEYELRIELIKHQFRNLQQLEFPLETELDEFMFHQLKSDTVKALSYFFFAYGDESKNHDSKIFLKNSLQSISEVKKDINHAYRNALADIESAHLEAVELL